MNYKKLIITILIIFAISIFIYIAKLNQYYFSEFDNLIVRCNKFSGNCVLLDPQF